MHVQELVGRSHGLDHIFNSQEEAVFLVTVASECFSSGLVLSKL